MIKAVFFDIDDTLYNSTKLADMARKNSIAAMIDAGLPVKNEKKVYNILQEIIKKFGSNYPRHYDELLKALGLEWNPEIIAAGVVAYEHTKAGYLKPFPGVVRLLLKLKENYRLGVISNGLAVKQWEKLIGLGINHFFEKVVTSEEEGYTKPQKEIFESAIEFFKLKPSETVMVGDRLDTDILGGNRAGMVTVWINRSKKKFQSMQKPTFEVSEIAEIYKVIKSI